MKLETLFKENKEPLATSFDSGEQFMDYIYDVFGKKAYVEKQGDDTWLAEIPTDGKLGGAMYDGHSKMVTWTDHEMEPIPELNPKHAEFQ